MIKTLGLVAQPQAVSVYGDRTPVAMLGDSITVTYNLLRSTTTSTFKQQGHVAAANAWLGQRMTLINRGGINGGKAEDVLEDVADVVASGAIYCFVMVGTNDADSDPDLPNFKLEVAAIWDALIAGGVEPILCTIPAQGSTTNGGILDAANAAFLKNANTWILEQAAVRGLRSVDIYDVTKNRVDDSLAQHEDLMFVDNKHPSGWGGVVMGKAIYDVLNTIISYVPMDVFSENVLTNSALTGTGGTANVGGGAGSITGNVPDSWRLQISTGDANVTITTVAADASDPDQTDWLQFSIDPNASSGLLQFYPISSLSSEIVANYFYQHMVDIEVDYPAGWVMPNSFFRLTGGTATTEISGFTSQDGIGDAVAGKMSQISNSFYDFTGDSTTLAYRLDIPYANTTTGVIKLRNPALRITEEEQVGIPVSGTVFQWFNDRTQLHTDNDAINITTYQNKDVIEFYLEETYSWLGRTKCEVRVKDPLVIPLGDTYEHEYHFVIPDAWASTTWDIIWQIHSPDELNDQPPISFGVEDGDFYVRNIVTGGNGTMFSVAYTPDTEIQVKLQLKLHPTNGSIKLWVDGVEEVDWEGPTALDDTEGNYLRFGQYANGTWGVAETRTLYVSKATLKQI